MSFIVISLKGIVTVHRSVFIKVLRGSWRAVVGVFKSWREHRVATERIVRGQIVPARWHFE